MITYTLAVLAAFGTASVSATGSCASCGWQGLYRSTNGLICSQAQRTDQSSSSEAQTYCFGCHKQSNDLKARCGLSSGAQSDVTAAYDAEGSFSIIQDSPAVTKGSDTDLEGITTGHAHICGVAQGDLYCAYTGSDLSVQDLGTPEQPVSLISVQRPDYLGLFTSARQISLPTCYAEPKPYTDAYIAQQDDNDRNLLLSYVSVVLGSHDDEEVAGNAMRPSAGWQKARFNDECEDLFDGEVPSTPTTRPAHRTFSGEGASTTTGSCFLMEGQVPSIVDDQNDVLFGNVQCFGPISLGFSPSGVYHSRETAAYTRMPSLGLGPVPIGTYVDSELAARKATQIVAGALHYCVLYEPETVGTNTYDDTRVVCWGVTSAAVGKGLGEDENEAALDPAPGIVQPIVRRTSVENVAGDLYSSPVLYVAEAKPVEVVMNERDEVLELVSLHSAVCARVRNSDITGDTTTVLLRCWGDWDNLKAAGLLPKPLRTRTYANRFQLANMDPDYDGPPYLWLGRGWGWNAADFDGTTGGYSIEAFGASVDGQAFQLYNFDSFDVSSGPQAACFAAAPISASAPDVAFRGGIVCVQEPLPMGATALASMGGKTDSNGPVPATVSSTDFLEFLGTADGSGDLVVHELAVTNTQACALYSTDDVARGMKCWGDPMQMPAVSESAQGDDSVAGSGIAAQGPLLPAFDEGATCSSNGAGSSQVAESTSGDDSIVITAVIDITYSNAGGQLAVQPSPGGDISIPARSELTAAGDASPDASVPIADVSANTEACGVTVTTFNLEIVPGEEGDDSGILFVNDVGDAIRAKASALDFESFPEGGWQYTLKVTVQFSNGESYTLEFPGVFKITDVNEAPAAAAGSSAGSTVQVQAPINDAVTIASSAAPAFEDPESGSSVVYYLHGKDVTFPNVEVPSSAAISSLSVDRSSGAVTLSAAGLEYSTDDEVPVRLVACDGELDESPSGGFNLDTQGVLCSIGTVSLSNTVTFTCKPGAGEDDTKTCSSCAPGRFQPLVGALACQSCSPGRFQPLEGSATCNQCESGSINHADFGQVVPCFQCTDADENAEPNADSTACVCSEGFEAEGDSGEGRGEAISCEPLAEIDTVFGSSTQFRVSDDTPLPVGRFSGVQGTVTGGGDRDLELAVVFDGDSSPSLAGGMYAGKALLNIKPAAVAPPAGAFITDGEDAAAVTDVSSEGTVVVKPVSGRIRTGGSPTSFSLEVSFPESGVEEAERTINYEELPADSRQFDFRVVVRSGPCAAGKERTQACKDSAQSIGPLTFKARDLVDPPQLGFRASTAAILEQAGTGAGKFSFVRGIGNVPTEARPDGRLSILPSADFTTSFGGSPFTFATEDAEQPEVRLTAELRLRDSTDSTPVDLDLTSRSFQATSVPLPSTNDVPGGAATLRLPELRRFFVFGEDAAQNLRCSTACPNNLEIVVTATAVGQRANAESPQIVLPITVQDRPEAPRFNRRTGQVSFPETATSEDEPTSDELNYLRVGEPDENDQVVSCSVDDDLFEARLGESSNPDKEENESPGRSVLLRVAAGRSLDYETQVQHTVKVTCTDESGFKTPFATIVVNVNDVFENRPPFAPQVLGSGMLAFDENPSEGQRMEGALSVGDPDEGDLEDLTVVVQSCDDGTDENGLPLCDFYGESGIDISACVEAVEVTDDPYDAYTPGTSRRLFGLAFKPSGEGCGALLDFETDFSGSSDMQDRRLLRLVVEDNQPASRRLASLGGDSERHASFRRRLASSATLLEIEIRDVDEQVVIIPGVQTPIVYQVDENDVPNFPLQIAAADNIFRDPDGFSDQLFIDWSIEFVPQQGQTPNDEPTDQVEFLNDLGILEQRSNSDGFDFESPSGNVFVYRLTVGDPDLANEGPGAPGPASVLIRIEVQDVNEAPRRLRSSIAFSVDEQSTDLQSSSGLDMSALFRDQDAGDSLTITLRIPDQIAAAYPLTISSEGIVSMTGGPIAFEDVVRLPQTQSPTVVATDSGNLKASIGFSFTVRNLEFDPEFQSGDIAASIEENVAGPVVLGELDATDRDRSDEVTYQVVGDSAALFQISTSAGVTTISYAGSGEDFEAMVANGGSNIVTVTVAALDGKVALADADTVTVTLTVLDVVEAPVVLSQPALDGIPASIRKNAAVGSAIVGASVAFSHPDPVTVDGVLTCHCTHLKPGQPSGVTDGACEADGCFETDGLEIRITPGDGDEPSTAQVVLADASVFDGGAGSYQIEMQLVAEDGSATDTIRFRVAVLCPEITCEAGFAPLGSCAADQPQRCVAISGAGNTDEYDFSIGPNAETRNGFENGKLTLMQTQGRARGDSCESTLRVAWYQGDKPAWYRDMIEPHREFRVQGLDNGFQADVVLAQGQQGFLEVLKINGGNRAVTGLAYRLGTASEADSFTRIGGTSTVGTRCFCAPCGSSSEYKNPVCRADTYDASQLAQADWCLECSTCRSGSEYETKSCRGSHPDDEEDIFQNRECAACTTCGYDQYEVGGCTGREDRECADRLVEGYPRPYRSEGNSGPYIVNSFSNNRKNAQCMAQVQFVWSTRDRSESGGEGWFMIKETRHSSVNLAYVFHATDGEELQLVLGKQRKNDQRYQLYRYGRWSSTEQPAERPSSSDSEWHSIGRAVDIGRDCVEEVQAANVIEVEETSRYTGSWGRLEYAIANNQRDENCRVIVRVSYAGDTAELAPTATFLLRETRHSSIPLARQITMELGTTALVDLGDRATFGNKNDVRITMLRPDGRGGWIQTCRSLSIGRQCLSSPPEADRSTLQPVDLRWDQVTGQGGRLEALYGNRRSAEGRAVMRVAYYDPDGPSYTTFRVRETRHSSVDVERQVTLQNGFSAIIDMGSREDLGRKNDVRFGLFYDSMWWNVRGNWRQRMSIDLGSRDLETFPEAAAVSAEFPRSTVERTWSRGTISAVYGRNRSPGCDVVVRVAFNDPSGCEGEKRTFVVRETRHSSIQRAFQVTLTNGQETLLNLGSRADFRNKNDIRISLQYYDTWRAEWRTTRSLDIGRHCTNDYSDESDLAAFVPSETKGYDSWSSWGGRIETIWKDRRAPGWTGWVDNNGRSVEECDVAVRVSYFDRFGPDSKRFLVSESRHSSVSFNKVVELENGQSKVLVLGPRSTFRNKNDLRFALSTYSSREGNWVQTRREEVSFGRNCVPTFEAAEIIPGYPVANYAPTRTNSALVDFETVVGDTNRLADGSIALTLRYCSDERFDPDSVTVVLRETRHSSIDWSAQLVLQRCTETIAVVPVGSLRNKRDVRISAYLLESDADLRHISTRSFGYTRLPITRADLEPAGTGSSSSGGAASASSIRGGVSSASTGSPAALGVSSRFAASTAGVFTIMQVQVAAETGDATVFSSLNTAEAAAAYQLTATVQAAGVDAQVFLNAEDGDGNEASIVIVPASQRAAAEAALEAASSSAGVQLTDRLVVEIGEQPEQGAGNDGAGDDSQDGEGSGSNGGASAPGPSAVSPVLVGAVVVAALALVGMVAAIAVAVQLRVALNDKNRVNPQSASGGAMPSVGDGIDVEVESDGDVSSQGTGGGDDEDAASTGSATSSIEETEGGVTTAGASSPHVPRVRVRLGPGPQAGGLTGQRAGSRADLLRSAASFSPAAPLGSRA